MPQIYQVMLKMLFAKLVIWKKNPSTELILLLETGGDHHQWASALKLIYSAKLMGEKKKWSAGCLKVVLW